MTVPALPNHPEFSEALAAKIATHYIITLGLRDLYNSRPMFVNHPNALAILDKEIDRREIDLAREQWRIKRIRGHLVIRGWRYDDEGGWMMWVVVERKPGTTYKTLKRISELAGIGYEHHYGGPGRPYSHPGWRRAVTRTRALFIQSGGLDI